MHLEHYEKLLGKLGTHFHGGLGAQLPKNNRKNPRSGPNLTAIERRDALIMFLLPST